MIRIATFVLATMLLVTSAASAQQALKKVPPGQLDQYWIYTNSHVIAQAPNSGQGLSAIGCVAVSYTIGSDGVTRNVKVEKVVPSTSDFQILGSSFIKGLHYRAASGNPHQVPVQTYFIMPLNVPDNSPDIMIKMIKACHLPGYGD